MYVRMSESVALLAYYYAELIPFCVVLRFYARYMSFLFALWISVHNCIWNVEIIFAKLFSKPKTSLL